MRHRHFLRLLLTSLLSLSILLTLAWTPFFFQAPAALAHAFVIGSDPVDGSTIPANNARELDTPLLSPSTLPQGSYEVKWTAIATDDGHATHGLIGFNLGYSVTGLSGTPTLGPITSNILPQLNQQGVLAIMWEWLTSLALIFWIGIVIIESLLVLGAGASPGDSNGGIIPTLKKQGRPLQWLCLSALLVGEIINLILRSALLTTALTLPGIDVAAIRQLVLETSYGHLWLIRMGLICLALIFLWWTTRGQNKAHLSALQTRARESLASPARTTRAGASPARTLLRSGLQRRIGYGLGLPPPWSSKHFSKLRQGLPPPWSKSRFSKLRWLILAGLILLTMAFSADTAQLAQQQISAIVLIWLQLLAQAAWFGGAAYLGFVLLPLLPTIASDSRGELLVNVLRSYTPLLLAALSVLFISELFLIETTISDASQWLNDPYGRALLINILLLVLMLIFTGYSFFYLLPKLRRQIILLPVVNADLPARRTRRSVLEQTESSLKRAMHILTVMGAFVLLCAAFMGFFAPPIVFPPLNIGAISSLAHSTNGQATQTQQVGNLSVSLEVVPAQADTSNTVIITLKDNSGTPVTDAHVRISTNMELMNMGTARKDLLAQDGSSTYVAVFSAGQAFSMAGSWDVTLSIQRPNSAPVQAQFVVTLQ